MSLSAAIDDPPKMGDAGTNEGHRKEQPAEVLGPTRLP